MIDIRKHFKPGDIFRGTGYKTGGEGKFISITAKWRATEVYPHFLIAEDAHDHTVTFDTGDLVKNKLINEFAGV